MSFAITRILCVLCSRMRWYQGNAEMEKRTFATAFDVYVTGKWCAIVSVTSQSKFQTWHVRKSFQAVWMTRSSGLSYPVFIGRCWKFTGSTLRALMRIDFCMQPARTKPQCGNGRKFSIIRWISCVLKISSLF